MSNEKEVKLLRRMESESVRLLERIRWRIKQRVRSRHTIRDAINGSRLYQTSVTNRVA